MQKSNIQAYPPAAVIAEKFQAMAAIGAINGRMKDYHDPWAIPSAIEIRSADLDAAISATFARKENADFIGSTGGPASCICRRSCEALPAA